MFDCVISNIIPKNMKETEQKDSQTIQQSMPFVYDGRRKRVLSERKAIDYSSSVIYSKLFPNNNRPHIKSYLHTKLEHVSINKVKCGINVIKWSPDGRRLISGTSTGELTLWNGFCFNFETIMQAHESPVRSMCWSPSGSFLISGDALGAIKYWHPSMTNIHLINAHSETIRDLSFGPFDSKFCSCSDDGTVKVFDSQEAKEERCFQSHNWDVRAAQWHPTKALIASGGKDCSLKLFDPRGKEITTKHLHKNTIFTLKWSTCGNFLITGSKDQTIKMLDIRNMNVFTYKTYSQDISSLTVHPHVQNVFVGACASGNMNFYQLFNEEPTYISEKCHDNVIWSVDYHPMGHILASSSIDFSVKFWVKDNNDEMKNDLVIKNENENYESDDGIPGL